jgi:hypothetical protein
MSRCHGVHRNKAANAIVKTRSKMSSHTQQYISLGRPRLCELVIVCHSTMQTDKFDRLLACSIARLLVCLCTNIHTIFIIRLVIEYVAEPLCREIN